MYGEYSLNNVDSLESMSDTAEVTILCSMDAMLSGRQSPMSSSCGQSGPGGGKIMEEELAREEGGKRGTKKESRGKTCAGNFTFVESLQFHF